MTLDFKILMDVARLVLLNLDGTVTLYLIIQQLLLIKQSVFLFVEMARMYKERSVMMETLME